MTPNLRPGRVSDLDTHAFRLTRAPKFVTDCLAHLDDQRALVASLRAASYDDTRSGSGISDPTAGVVVAMDHVEYRRSSILDAIATIGVAINVLEAACSDALRYRAHTADADDTTDERCIGDGTPAGATCSQIPDVREIGGRTDGRCIDCGKRYDQRIADARRERDESRADDSNARRVRRYTARRTA